MTRSSYRKKGLSKSETRISISNHCSTAVIRPYPQNIQNWQSSLSPMVDKSWEELYDQMGKHEKSLPSYQWVQEGYDDNRLSLPPDEQNIAITAYLLKERPILGVVNAIKKHILLDDDEKIEILRLTSVPEEIEKKALREVEIFFPSGSSLAERFKNVKPNICYVWNNKIIMTVRYYEWKEMNTDVYSKFESFYKNYAKDSVSPISTYISRENDES